MLIDATRKILAVAITLAAAGEARNLLKTVINLYNQERPHMSIGNLTPNQVYQNNIKTEKLWK
ncbi:hypothetical protein D7036_19940, partial [Aquimarina sp. BL5]|uniref:integrase core domain-containing protein n=1 Tax=Aquimarina sp. BL5 TaxID=1714860 RepID=UPI000ED837FE